MTDQNQPVLYRHAVTGRLYRLVDEVDGICHLEQIDRRVTKVKREIIEDIGSVWERTV